jgi:endonuclease YncB( thermonuclease family)
LGKQPQSIQEGIVERVVDGDTVTVITANQTKLRIRMLGIDAPETPKGTKFPGQPYGPEAEVYLKQLVEDKRVRSAPPQRLMSWPTIAQRFEDEGIDPSSPNASS